MQIFFRKRLSLKLDVKFIFSALLIIFSCPLFASEFVMNCGYYAYKMDTNLFGWQKRVREKLISHDIDWRQFCQRGEVTFEGSVVSCKYISKTFYRINPSKIAATARKFECPTTAEGPNQPKFLRLKETAQPGYEAPLLIFRIADPHRHFEEQNCKYLGENVDVPMVENSDDGDKWIELDFPPAYPFIEADITNSMADEIYERLVFGDIDSSYTLASGSMYLTYLDFALGTVTKKSYRIDPYTEEPDINNTKPNVYHCEKIILR